MSLGFCCCGKIANSRKLGWPDAAWPKNTKQNKQKTNKAAANKHDQFCDLYLVHSGFPPVRKWYRFPWGRPGSPMRGLCAVVLFCGCFSASLNCLPPFAVTVPEVLLTSCTLVRGSCALCSCENHKDSLGMTHQCSGGPLHPKSTPVRRRVGHGLPYKSCRPLLFPGS